MDKQKYGFLMHENNPSLPSFHGHRKEKNPLPLEIGKFFMETVGFSYFV